MKDQNENNNTNDHQSGSNLRRRDIIKGMASLPVLGFFGYEFAKIKPSLTTTKRKPPVNMLKKLGLNANLQFENFEGKSKDTIRLGIIGAGSRGTELLFRCGFTPKAHIEEMKKNAGENSRFDTWLSYDDMNAVVTGVCDVFDMHAERALDAARNGVKAYKGEKIPEVKRYRHYQELLASPDIDAVIVATPDHHHAHISVEALQAGKHVYCEKAPTRTEEEIRPLVNAAHNSNLVYQLGHQIRHNPIYPFAADMVSRGVLGAVNLVEVTTNRNSASGAWVRNLNSDGTPKPGDTRSIDWGQWLGNSPKVPFSLDRYYNWTKYFDYSTGLLGQLFSHEFDSVNGILNCGIPASCVSSGGIYYYKDGREIPDLLQVVFEYPDRGMTLIYSATLANSRSRGRVFMGRDASLEIGSALTVVPDRDSVKYREELDQHLIDSSKPMINIAPGKSDIDAITSATEKYYSDRGLTSVSIGGKTQDVTHLHLKEWLNVIRNGGQVSCPVDRAFQEAVTIQMAKKAYFEGRKVIWDPVNQKIV
jgi:predicted dehydrogenase